MPFLGHDRQSLAHYNADRTCIHCGHESPTVDIVAGEDHDPGCPLYARKRPASRS